MNDLLFWKGWGRDNRTLYQVILFLLICSLAYFLYTFFNGYSLIINWEVGSELNKLNVIIDSFYQHLFDIKIQAPSYFIKENFEGSTLNVNHRATYIFAGLTFLSIALILSILPRLSRIWFVAGIFIFSIFIKLLDFKALGIFGQVNYWPLAVVATVLIGPSVYFHLKHPLRFYQRFIIFLVLFTVILFTAFRYADLEYASLHMMSHAIALTLIITIIFIFLISTEIIRGFLYLIATGHGENQKNTSISFLGITLLYLLNVILAYLHEEGIVTWNILYINPFILFIISLILGIWGHRTRSSSYSSIINFAPSGALWYLALALISLATISFAFATGNTPVVESISYFIYYTHMVMGVVFIVYVLVNFGKLMEEGHKVHKILSDPKSFSLAAARFIGIFIIFLLLVRDDMDPYKQIRAGSYNLLGDMYYANNNMEGAKNYYLTAKNFDASNHKSDYALASIFKQNNQQKKALEYFKKAIEEKASPFAYIGLSNIQSGEKKYFESLFTLQDGIKKFPESGHLWNNLALNYHKTGASDSAIISLNLANHYLNNHPVPSANRLYFHAQQKDSLILDSLIQSFRFDNNASYVANQLSSETLLNKNKKKKKWNPGLIKDSSLSNSAFGYCYNYHLNKVRNLDSSDIKRIHVFENRQPTYKPSLMLKFLRSCGQFYGTNKPAAVRNIESISKNYMLEQGYYFTLLGKWMLRQNSYRAAAHYFKRAVSVEHPDAPLNYALALTEAGLKSSALKAWEQTENSSLKERMKIVLKNDSIQPVHNWPDEMKIHFLRYRKNDFRPEKLYQTYKTIRDNNMKTLGTAELLNAYRETGKATEILNTIKNIPSKSTGVPYIDHRLNQEYLLTLSAAHQWDKLNKQINQLPVSNAFEPRITYLKARIAEQHKDTAKAKELYKKSFREDPYFKTGIIRAARFYRETLNDLPQAYHMLLKGTRVNEFSPEIHKAFALSCLRMRLDEDASKNYKRVKKMVPEAAFEEFKKQYHTLRDSIAETNKKWEQP